MTSPHIHIFLVSSYSVVNLETYRSSFSSLLSPFFRFKLYVSVVQFCSKNWSSSYFSLLYQFNCPTLSSRHLFGKLILPFFSPSNTIFFQPPSYLSTRSKNLLVPFVRTSAFPHSFVPPPSGTLCFSPLFRPSSLWNSLLFSKTVPPFLPLYFINANKFCSFLIMVARTLKNLMFV